MGASELRLSLIERIMHMNKATLEKLDEVAQLAEMQQDELPEWQQQLLNERIASYETNPENVKDWKNAEKELRNKLESL